MYYLLILLEDELSFYHSKVTVTNPLDKFYDKNG